MDVLVISKAAFNCTEYDDIKNIAFSETQFTITKSDKTTHTKKKPQKQHTKKTNHHTKTTTKLTLTKGGVFSLAKCAGKPDRAL